MSRKRDIHQMSSNFTSTNFTLALCDSRYSSQLLFNKEITSNHGVIAV
jgi:hypothetical protein